VFNDRAIRLKQKFARGECSPGIWMRLASATTAEVIAQAGFDWVAVDLEHTPFNPETLQHMLMGFKGVNTVPLVRVPWNDHVMIKQTLDMGWDGVIVPQVNTAEEARRAVAACRYAPLGNRGFGPIRAGNYGRDRAEYVHHANESVFCVIQVENVPCLEKEAEEIVRVPGIDGIWIGPCDMSSSINCFLETEHPRIWNAVGKLFALAKQAGIPTSEGTGGAARLKAVLDMGCQWVLVGEDITFLIDSSEAVLQTYRQALAKIRQEKTA
jgi:4-hydroxy-2-oxoheptanedioate aldolase